MFFLSACQAPVVHNTPSRRPEVTIKGITAKELSSYLTNEMLNGGYALTKQSNYFIAFDYPVENATKNEKEF